MFVTMPRRLVARSGRWTLTGAVVLAGVLGVGCTSGPGAGGDAGGVDPGGPDLRIAVLEVEPEAPSDDQAATVTVVVQNLGRPNLETTLSVQLGAVRNGDFTIERLRSFDVPRLEFAGTRTYEIQHVFGTDTGQARVVAEVPLDNDVDQTDNQETLDLIVVVSDPLAPAAIAH